MFWFNHGKGIYFSYNIAHSVAFIICNNQKTNVLMHIIRTGNALMPSYHSFLTALSFAPKENVWRHFGYDEYRILASSTSYDDGPEHIHISSGCSSLLNRRLSSILSNCSSGMFRRKSSTACRCMFFAQVLIFILVV